MTIEEALKVWHDSTGFNEIECGRDLQESITVAFRSLEAWNGVIDDLKSLCGDLLREWGVFPIETVIMIIKKHLSEVEK